jgi:hypothetical protein
MADLTEIITAQVEAAGGGEGVESPDVDTDNGGVDNAEVVGDKTTETPGSEGVTAPEGTDGKPAKDAATPEIDPATGQPKVVEKPAEVKAKTPEEEQFDKDMAELGIKAPKEGERENRLPHTRVQKIVQNYGKKLTERHNAVLAAKDAEYAPYKTTAENTAKVDNLIVTDPDRYIGLLAAMHPEQYGKFVKGGQVEKKTEEVKPNEALAKLGPRPVADHKFEDGSVGYTPEQHDKLLDWVAQKARIDAEVAIEEKFTKRFGPIEKAYNTVQARNAARTAAIPKVKAEVSAVYQTWGRELVDKHEAKIIEAMQKNPDLSPADAAATILVPILRADRTKMRTELIDEVNRRPAAAQRSEAGATTVDKTPAGETSSDPVENAIRGAVATLRR